MTKRFLAVGLILFTFTLGAPAFAQSPNEFPTSDPPVAGESENSAQEAPGPEPAPTTNPTTPPQVAQEPAPPRQQSTTATASEPAPPVRYIETRPRTTWEWVSGTEAPKRPTLESFRRVVEGRTVSRDTYGNFALEGVSDLGVTHATEALVAFGQAKVVNGKVRLSESLTTDDLLVATMRGTSVTREGLQEQREVNELQGKRDAVQNQRLDNNWKLGVNNAERLTTFEGDLTRLKRSNQATQGVLEDHKLWLVDHDGQLNRSFWSQVFTWLAIAGFIGLLIWLATRGGYRGLPAMVRQLRDDVDALDGRVGATEAAIVAQNGRVGATEANVTALQAEVAAIGGNLTTQTTRINGLVNGQQALAARIDDQMTGLDALNQRSQMLRQDLTALEGNFGFLEQRQTALGARVDQVEASDAQVRALLGIIAVNTATPLPQGWQQQPTPTP